MTGEGLGDLRMRGENRGGTEQGERELLGLSGCPTWEISTDKGKGQCPHRYSKASSLSPGQRLAGDFPGESEFCPHRKPGVVEAHLKDSGSNPV